MAAITSGSRTECTSVFYNANQFSTSCHKICLCKAYNGQVCSRGASNVHEGGIKTALKTPIIMQSTTEPQHTAVINLGVDLPSSQHPLKVNICFLG